MYVISGTTKQVDLNLHALGKGFLRESSILGKTIELSHSCLKDQEKGIGMCRRGGRYDIRWCVLATMSRWGCLEYKVMRDKNHMRKKMWYQEWMTLWVLEVMQKNLRLASYINCLPSQDTWNESVTDNPLGKQVRTATVPGSLVSLSSGNMKNLLLKAVSCSHQVSFTDQRCPAVVLAVSFESCLPWPFSSLSVGTSPDSVICSWHPCSRPTACPSQFCSIESRKIMFIWL